MIKKDNLLFSDFEPKSKADWEIQVIKDLKGGQLEDIQHTIGSHLSTKPYYTIEDLPENIATGIIPENMSSSDNPRSWVNYESIEVIDEHSANKQALHALSMGADGIVFQLLCKPKLSVLLDQIGLQHCSVSFSSKANIPGFADDYQDFVKIRGTGIHSGFLDIPGVFVKSPWPKFYAVLVANKIPDPVESLVAILSSLVDILAPIDENDILVYVKSIGYKIEPGLNYFASIAYFRALRILLYNFFKGYGLTIPAESFFILAKSGSWVNNDYEPHGNVLKATTSVMAAIAGGCQAVQVFPENTSTDNIQTIRNISTILKEESYFDKTSNPTDGSYYIESLVHEITRISWDRFLKVVKL